jgi:hypothetical protein
VSWLFGEDASRLDSDCTARAQCSEVAIRKRLGPGRPRKSESKLSRWLDAAGMTRYELAERLKIGRGHADRICRGERRPSLELAVEIERLTDGAIPASTWTSIPKHGRD